MGAHQMAAGVLGGSGPMELAWGGDCFPFFYALSRASWQWPSLWT